MGGALIAVALGCLGPILLWRLELSVAQGRVVHNCREIVTALNAYATEHAGLYPDGPTANVAFRLLIKNGYVRDENLFGLGYYAPDGHIGEGPEYPQALEPGENGWAMTKGLATSAVGATPLIFENPLLATWPPRWDAKAVGSTRPGRIWPNFTILVGCVDGSINAERLVRDDGPTTTLRPIKNGKNLFELAGPHEVLDVAR